MPRSLPVLLLALTLIAACGQKGPLYLPGEAPRPVLPGAKPAEDPAAGQAATEPAPEDDEEDEKTGDRRP